ncbi:MAG: hybrid sensor histidine kinase/response regulator [Arcobacteraceae bacterium]|nr:hybrid sensor histidine kinase/response regulator [Arcobacteraceae bacterium]
MQINILIVDDIKANLIALEALLETIDENYNIIQANSGSEALEFALNEKIDLIILDIQMPDMDGFEVAQLLKSNKETSDIPVIFLTAAFKSDEWIKKGFKLGAVDYLTKPIDENQFINRIALYTKLIKLVEDNRNKDRVLFESSKMVSMGEMIGNIAHQWRQPLSVISTGATGLQMQKEYGLLTDEVFEETCSMIDKNAQYLSKTIDDFRNFIKGDRVKEVFSLKEDIDSFLHLVEGSIKKHNINMVVDVSDDIKINGYANELTQCFINIFNNAKDVLDNIDEENRYIFISAFCEDGGTSQKRGQSVIIKIKDSGSGIPDDVIKKVFEPYFTTKHQSQGTGLGLHMTYNLVVTGMQGKITVENETYEYEGKEYTGAQFFIELPIS